MKTDVVVASVYSLKKKQNKTKQTQISPRKRRLSSGENTNKLKLTHEKKWFLMPQSLAPPHVKVVINTLLTFKF